MKLVSFVVAILAIRRCEHDRSLGQRQGASRRLLSPHRIAAGRKDARRLGIDVVQRREELGVVGRLEEQRFAGRSRVLRCRGGTRGIAGRLVDHTDQRLDAHQAATRVPITGRGQWREEFFGVPQADERSR